MLKIAIRETPTPRNNIHFCPELSHPRTLHSIQAAQKIWRNAQFTLVIGSDLATQLPRWYCVEQWITAVNLLIVPRPGAPLNPETLAELRQLGAVGAIAPLMGLDTSSTAYREHRNPQTISPAIQAYIHQAQLYPCQDLPPNKPIAPPIAPPISPPIAHQTGNLARHIPENLNIEGQPRQSPDRQNPDRQNLERQNPDKVRPPRQRQSIR